VCGNVTREAARQRYSPRVADEQRETVVERDEVAVMFKRIVDEQTSISRGWLELEEAVGSLRGRKFYGAFDETSHEYRVCVQLRESDEPAGLGLEVGTLPGGRYAQVRLKGEPPAVYECIAPAFETLARRADRDRTRPGIEFYRRRDVIDLLLPII
jgi:hypothetical protein